MILTTNRISAIDIAVQSRIHFAIQYQDLDADQKFAIYRNFLDKIGDDDISDRENMYKQLNKLCKRRTASSMNGRQIRNIVTSAQALAASQDVPLEFDHINHVYDTTVDFLESLKDLTQQKRGRNEALVMR